VWTSLTRLKPWPVPFRSRPFCWPLARCLSGMTESEPPHLNIDTPWSEMDDLDICWGVGHGRSLEETADFLCRSRAEIRARMRDLGLA
jgi:hypothetical protein